MGGARKSAFMARGGDAPAFLEETPAYSVMASAVEKIQGTAFGTIVTKGGEPLSMIEGGPKEARAHFTPQQVNPAKGVVIGAGGRGFDDTFSHTLRVSLGALKSVRKGGDILLVGECRDGIGSEALQMQAMGRISDAALRKGFYADGMEEIGYLDSLKENYTVTLLSSLPELYASGRFRFRTANNSVEALQKVFNSTGRGAKLHVFTRAWRRSYPRAGTSGSSGESGRTRASAPPPPRRGASSSGRGPRASPGSRSWAGSPPAGRS